MNIKSRFTNYLIILIFIISIFPTTTYSYDHLFQIFYDISDGKGDVPTDSKLYSYQQEIFIQDSRYFSKKGFDFSHWNTDPDGVGLRIEEFSTINYPYEKDFTIYAIWENEFSCNIYSGLIPNALFVDPHNLTLTGSVPESTLSVFPQFNLSEGATFKLYADINKNHEITSNSLDLKLGENIFYVETTASYGNSLMYTLSITRGDGFSNNKTGVFSETTSTETDFEIKINNGSFNLSLEQSKYTLDLPKSSTKDSLNLIKISPSLLKELKADNKGNSIEIRTYFASWTIPVDLTSAIPNYHKTLIDLSLKEDDISIWLGMKLNPLITNSSLEKTYANYELLENIVEFYIEIVNNETERPILSVDQLKVPTYKSITLNTVNTQDGSNYWGNWGVYRIIDSSSIEYVPGEILITNGVCKLVLNTFQNDTFCIIKNNISFVDIDNHWARTTILPVARKGILVGKTNSYYHPNDYLTRAEFLAAISKVLGMPTGNIEDISYKDVSSQKWYARYVANGELSGALDMFLNDNFLPEEPIKREEICLMIFYALKNQNDYIDLNILNNFEDSIEVNFKYLEAVSLAIQYEILVGSDNKLRPIDNLTRAEGAVILKKLADLYPDLNMDYTISL